MQVEAVGMIGSDARLLGTMVKEKVAKGKSRGKSALPKCFSNS
jgi:hypothetical protein